MKRIFLKYFKDIAKIRRKGKRTMERVYPHYYKEFSCIAGECEDTCCAGWQIMIDDVSIEKYRGVKGGFGNRLHNCIDWKEQAFMQNGKRCAFLNEENLCDIYTELGEKGFCDTCKNYPRHMEEYENLREYMLSLSCPEACRLILKQKQPISFEWKEDDQYEEYEEFDFLLFTKLEDTREYIEEIMKKEGLGFRDKMSIALVFAHDMQRRIQNDCIFEIDDLLMKYEGKTAISDLQQRFRQYDWNKNERIKWLKAVKQQFQAMEPLKLEWHPYLEQSFEILMEISDEEYKKLREEFYTDYPSLERELMNIFETFLYTYFCGAVYDEEVLPKVKFMILSVWMIEQLDLACWLAKGKQFTFEDQVKITHWYSREIEHSDQNLGYLDKKLKSNPIFHYKMLLKELQNV